MSARDALARVIRSKVELGVSTVIGIDEAADAVLAHLRAAGWTGPGEGCLRGKA